MPLKPSQKRERIIAAAARVFARKGFFSASVAEIATEAGVGKGTIYGYVSSKDDLFFAVFEWIAETSWTRARIGVSALGATASEKLRALSRSLLDQWADMNEFYGLVMEFWSASASSQHRDRFMDVFRQIYSNFRGIVSGLILEGMDRGEFQNDVDPDAVAAALVGTWDALILQAWFDDTFDLETTTDRFLSVVLRGLAAPECPALDGPIRRTP
ncbi:MAG: TetR/AcrR family transcriptional regulator [Desulfobacteraceae bacterium]|jgi:AcrR family transcriptional regulator